MSQSRNCPCCGQAVPLELRVPTAERMPQVTEDFFERLRQRARETDQEGRSPVITDRSPGVVYANAIRRARKLGYSV
jgi:hypothetical protein